MIGFIRFLYWKIRFKCCRIVYWHATLKDKSWKEMSFSERSDVYKTFVLTVTNKLPSKDITNEEL